MIIATPPRINPLGLVGWWRSSAAVAATGSWKDSSGDGNPGTLNGDAAVAKGVGVALDGTGDWGDCGNIAAMNSASKLTLAFWAYRAGTTQPMGVTKGITVMSYNTRFGIQIDVAGTGEVWFMNAVTVYTQAGYVAWDLSGWHHFAIVFDGTLTGDANRLKGFIDGAAQTLTSGGSAILATTANLTANLLIGNSNHPSYQLSTGKFDDLRVYSRPLSAVEVGLLYKRGRGRT